MDHRVGNLQVWLEQRIRLSFYHLGRWVGTRPQWCLFTCLCCTIVLSSGLFTVHETNDVREHFTAVDSASRLEYRVAREFFRDQGSPFYLVVAIRADDDGSLLRDDYIDKVMTTERHLQYDLKVEWNGYSHSFADLCGSQCRSSDAVHYFLSMFKDAERRHSPNVKLTYPTMDLFGERLYLANNLYLVSINERSQVVESCRMIALHFRTTFSNSTTEHLLQLWERAVLNYTSIKDHHSSSLRLSTTSEGLVSQEVRRAGMSAVPLMPISGVVILAFTVCTSLHWDIRRSKVWEAAIGVVCPLLALMSAFGTMFLLHIQYVPLATVVPFLILAIGVDDVFITLHAWRRSDHHLSMVDRLGETLADAGPSISITSATNALSFCIGALTPTPAIRIFCLYAAFSVLVSYIFQLFFFSAIVAIGGWKKSSISKRFYIFAYSGRREEKGLNAYFWCIYSKDKSAVQSPSSLRRQELLSHILDQIVNLAMSWSTRIVVAICLLCYWVVSINGIFHVTVGLSAEKLFLADSPLLEFMLLQKRVIFHEGDDARVKIPFLEEEEEEYFIRPDTTAVTTKITIKILSRHKIEYKRLNNN